MRSNFETFKDESLEVFLQGSPKDVKVVRDKLKSEGAERMVKATMCRIFLTLLNDFAMRQDTVDNYLVKGDVELEETIGHGGFAEVYRGKWRSQDVAVKRPLLKNSEDQVRREVRLLYRLSQSTAKISLAEIFRRQGDWFVILEYFLAAAAAAVLAASKILKCFFRTHLLVDDMPKIYAFPLPRVVSRGSGCSQAQRTRIAEA